MTAPRSPLSLAFPLARSTSETWLDRSRYPFAPRSFQHEDGAQHFIDEGSGSPVLFVHGTPSWSFEWHFSVFHLRSRFRCLAVDHLGFGLSDKPPNAPYLPKHHTDRLQTLLQTLDLGDVTLVVHDFGGPIALPLVVREPSRFRQVIAVNTWAWCTETDVEAGRLSYRAYAVSGVLYDAVDIVRAADGSKTLQQPVEALPSLRLCDGAAGPDGVPCVGTAK